MSQPYDSMLDRSIQNDWLDTNEYPFQSRYFQTSIGKMHYVDKGKGDPIVFIHGNPAWSFEYRKLIKGLSDHYRCIAPDHIGFGLSEKPFGWTYLPEDHAKNLESFLESLNLEKITLVVNDWGGPIGLSYALNHPEKVKNIVITNTWLWPVHKDWYYLAFSAFMGGPIGRWLIKKYNFFAKEIVKGAFGDKSKLTLVIHRHYLGPLREENQRKGCWTFPKRIIGSTKWLSQLWNQREKLQEKKMLIAWGMKDIAFREKELNRWTDAFPRARVIRYSDAGHFVAEEKGEELVSEIDDAIRNVALV